MASDTESTGYGPSNYGGSVCPDGQACRSSGGCIGGCIRRNNEVDRPAENEIKRLHSRLAEMEHEQRVFAAELAAERERAERAEAACAKKDRAIETALQETDELKVLPSETLSLLRAALSTDAGRAYAERMKRYRKALEFYANPDNWSMDDFGVEYLCERNAGGVAREALQETKYENAR